MMQIPSLTQQIHSTSHLTLLYSTPCQPSYLFFLSIYLSIPRDGRQRRSWEEVWREERMRRSTNKRKERRNNRHTTHLSSNPGAYQNQTHTTQTNNKDGSCMPSRCRWGPKWYSGVGLWDVGHSPWQCIDLPGKWGEGQGALVGISRNSSD